MVIQDLLLYTKPLPTCRAEVPNLEGSVSDMPTKPLRRDDGSQCPEVQERKDRPKKNIESVK
jgi:hypothetical protein